MISISRGLRCQIASRRHQRSFTSRLLLLCIFFLVTTTDVALASSSSESPAFDGPASLAAGKRLFEKGQYDEAATELWKAVLFHSSTPPDKQYDVQQVFQLFMQCYIVQNKMVDGLAFVALESFRRGQTEMGKTYLQQALAIDPHHEGALRIQAEHAPSSETTKKVKSSGEADGTVEEDDKDDLYGKTPEELYEIASGHFSEKQYEACADIFEISCQRSGYQLGPSCANAVYCRNMILDWGFNGSQFEQDMDRITTLTKNEVKERRLGTAAEEGGAFVWQRATSVHPHMMLGYPVDSMLKRYVAESVAYMDEKMARVTHREDDGNNIPPLPDDMPFEIETYRKRFRDEFTNNPNARIRVGFVGSGFNSKAVLYLSQDMFRFFNVTQFEIHVFSFGPPDNPLFIQRGMRGVDWRNRVKAKVDHFHDCQHLVSDHIQAARFIHEQNIHILIEWDGYARQGERAQGLFALRPAPIQMLHQEYLGTSGALYVDYIFSDLVTSPPELQHLYTEKIIYMPNHFFSKGHAYQAEVKKPTYDYLPKKTPYQLGTGSPQENRCMVPDNVGSKQSSFVFCNFNKFLKNNPETVRSWVRILREVPGSMLCLLENPTVGVPYFRKFVHEAAGTSSDNNDFDSFEPGDGDELNERIHFLPWERNPFDHQMRNQDFCNVMLDSYPYNGHTVAQDALYGGVPIVTRSDGDDMSSRVTTSANIVLGLEELNASGPRQYEDIAIRIGRNATFYQQMRNKLIDSCLQRNPMHPYWDVARYVKNFEVGLKKAWDLFLEGKPPEHIRIEETEEARQGTYDEEILAHPQEGKRLPQTHDEL